MIKQNPKQTPSSSSDSEFSRDLENHSPKYLSPTTVETLHTTSLHLPPSLLGKGVRGLGFALAFPQKVKSQTNDSGFTIIESLVGILIAAILLAAISPVLVMSTAIRVQSRRIEKATQAANTFIEGVRTGSIKAPSEYSDDNKIQLDAATADEPRTLAQNLINLTTMPLPDTKDDDDLYLFKQDGSICHTSETGCTKNSDSTFEEFYIQARQIIVTGSGVNDGYRLAIRVYRSDVEFDKPLLASTKDSEGNLTKQTASIITEGVGNKQAPAIEKTVDIGNVSTTFQALCQRLGLAPDKDGKAQNCQ